MKLATTLFSAAALLALPSLAAAQTAAPPVDPSQDAIAQPVVVIEQQAAPEAASAPVVVVAAPSQQLAPLQITVVTQPPPPARAFVVLDRERPPLAQPGAARGALAPPPVAYGAPQPMYVPRERPLSDRVAGAVPGYSRLGRVVLETLGGAAAGASGVFTGGMVGCAMVGGLNAGGGVGCIIVGTLLAVPIGTLGMAAGTVLANYLMDGTGRFGWAVLGAFAGVTLGAPIAALTVSLAPPLAIGAATALPLLGAVLATELSSADSRRAAEATRAADDARRARQLARNTVRVVPSVSPSSIGLIGTF